MSKAHRDLVIHLYEQSCGPPWAKALAREGFSEEFDACFKAANASIEGLYGGELDRLAQEPDAPSLFDLPKKESKLPESDLHHGRFTSPPAFARTRDLCEAARELQRVGVLRSADAFCDLIQQGRHPSLLPRAQPQVFKSGVGDEEFWMALVLLWSLGVHTQAHAAFDEAMKAVAPDEFHAAPGVKGFERSFEKAKEYKVEKKLEGDDAVLAGLHVIDGLRCSFTVKTIARNLEIGRALEAKYVAVRKKNGHQRANRSYADRKFNLRVGPFGADGGVWLLCEVQILMERYIEIKTIGHLLYEFQR